MKLINAISIIGLTTVLSTQSVLHAQHVLLVCNGPGGVLQFDSESRAPLGSFGPEVHLTQGIARGPACNLYVGSSQDANVRFYDGLTKAHLGICSEPPTQQNCRGITFGPNGILYIASSGNNRVLKLSSSCQLIAEISPPGGGAPFSPNGMIFGPDGKLYVASEIRNIIYRYDPQDDSWQVFSSGGHLNLPRGITFGRDNNLYAVNGSASANNIVRMDGLTGAYLAPPFVPSGTLHNAVGLVFGPDEHLYVANTDDSSVERFNGQSGAHIDTFILPGSGGLDHPVWLLFEAGPDCNGNGIHDECESTEDTDGDTVLDLCDNCLTVPNPDQADCDSDGSGDACDDDRDGDGVPNNGDACPNTPNCAVDATGRPKLDMNNDCNVDGADIQLIVNQLLSNCSQCP